MKWNWISATLFLVSFCAGARDKWSNWTLGLTFSSLPTQAVALAGIAPDFLCELICAFYIAPDDCQTEHRNGVRDHVKHCRRNGQRQRSIKCVLAATP
jgi:hypothetical protein